MTNINNGVLNGTRQPGVRVGAGPNGNLVMNTPGGRPGGATGLANPIYVESFGARGNGLTDDTAAIQATMNAAGPAGATVGFAPGRNYLISNHLLWDTTAQTTTQQAPSLIGSPGMGGPSADSGFTMGVSQITASPSFPLGEFMIDYLGPAPAGGSAGNTGFQVSGLVMQCASRAAGIRSFNSENSEWKYLVINKPATPNPAKTSGSPTGACNFLASPSYEAFNNRAERIFVLDSGSDSFDFDEGTGSFVWAKDCMAVNAGNSGYNCQSNTNLIGCISQGAAFAEFELKGQWISLTGCGNLSSGTTKNIVYIVGANNQVVNITGGQWYGSGKAGLTAQDGALIQIAGNTRLSMTGAAIRPGSGTSGSPILYVAAGATGSAVLTGCDCQQGSAYFSITWSGAVTNNSVGTTTVVFAHCPGVNPAGTLSISVPLTTVATAALPYDATFYVTAGAGGSTSLVISGGPTITVPASACVPVLVPAGQTLTPTYTSAPTWVVEGN